MVPYIYTESPKIFFSVFVNHLNIILFLELFAPQASSSVVISYRDR